VITKLSGTGLTLKVFDIHFSLSTIKFINPGAKKVLLIVRIIYKTSYTGKHNFITNVNYLLMLVDKTFILILQDFKK